MWEGGILIFLKVSKFIPKIFYRIGSWNREETL